MIQDLPKVFLYLNRGFIVWKSRSIVWNAMYGHTENNKAMLLPKMLEMTRINIFAALAKVWWSFRERREWKGWRLITRNSRNKRNKWILLQSVVNDRWSATSGRS